MLARGNQNVQIQHSVGSTITITYGGRARDVPLEPAVIPPGRQVRSPARLLRARSGVVPFAARTELLKELEGWLDSEALFAAMVVGGRGGTGKTRLGVELCERAARRGWLAGLLSRSGEQAAIEELVHAPAARLMVVDYAETRVEQLVFILPRLAGGATADHPVRVLLLLRAQPRGDSTWTASLAHRDDALDAVLDDADECPLEDAPLTASDRRQLWRAAAHAFSVRPGPTVAEPTPPDRLDLDPFGSPLLVVVAAYLAVHGESSTAATRDALLSELLQHEARYWSASAGDLVADPMLRRRAVALAALAGARDEGEAAELLQLLPDLRDASNERRASIARWLHGLYPATSEWWGALEPDLIAEHLIVECFGEQPAVLSGVLHRRQPAELVRPLDAYARAAADRPRFAAALDPVVAAELPDLCDAAIAQAATETDLDLLLGEETIAAALTRLADEVALSDVDLSGLINRFPPRPDLALSPLALALTERRASRLREQAGDDAAGFEPALATSLNNLSNRLGEAGRHDEALAAIQEAVDIDRRLSHANSGAFDPGLAMSLNNLSNRLGEAGRHDEALAAIQEAVDTNRRLAHANPSSFDPRLATSLNNLSIRLGEAGRLNEALAAIQEAVDTRRRLAHADPTAFEPHLATSLNNLCVRLGEAGRRDEALSAIREAVDTYRRLALANPAAFESDLAMSLNNLSNRLGEAGRRDEALAAIQEAVDTYRRLTLANRAVFEPRLATSLNNLSNQLDDAGRRDEALIAVQEAVDIGRRLTLVNPVAFEPHLAMSLNNLSIRLGETGRHDEGLAAIQEAVDIRRRLALANRSAVEPQLALSLNILSVQLGQAGRLDEALTAVQEAIDTQRQLAHANPATFEPDLAMSLNNLSNRLGEAGRHDEALAAIQEAVATYRRLADADPAVFEPDLATSLNNLANQLSQVGRTDESKSAADEAVAIAAHAVSAGHRLPPA